MKNHLELLQKEYRTGKNMSFLFFWGHTPPAEGKIDHSCFSQWWLCSFQIEGTRYSSTEQYMMAEKARLFQDENMLEKIMQTNKPKAIKAYGRAVKNFDSHLWEQRSYDIVKRGNAAKFEQNPELWDVLQQTGNRILVEASPFDRIWGIGMEKSDPHALNPMQWRGTNLLGFALTEVRNERLEKEEKLDGS
ncbi:NADAR family protein [Paenibacillus sp. 2TAB23]|uniref:NADAR family protein n=1 Tax=Paenibacillus sp. 2TAB23 TaxID=3233004 RepID=UPI003F991036